MKLKFKVRDALVAFAACIAVILVVVAIVTAFRSEFYTAIISGAFASGFVAVVAGLCNDDYEDDEDDEDDIDDIYL